MADMAGLDPLTLTRTGTSVIENDDISLEISGK